MALNITHINYHPQREGIWFLRYTGDSNRFYDMRKKILALDPAAHWNNNYVSQDGKRGGWELCWQDIAALMTQFDNVEQWMCKFTVLRAEAAAHFRTVHGKDRESGPGEQGQDSFELNLTHLAYSRYSRDVWFLRFEGPVARTRVLEKTIKEVAPDADWLPSYRFPNMATGAWRLLRADVVTLLNAFDNRAIWHSRFLALEDEAISYFVAGDLARRRAEEDIRETRRQYEEQEELRRKYAEEERVSEDFADYLYTMWKQMHGGGAAGSTRQRTQTPYRVIPVQVTLALEALGLDIDDRYEDAQKRYKVLAKQYHSDITGGNDDDLKCINVARDTLYRFQGWKK